MPYAKGVLPRALFAERNKTTITWPCGRRAVFNTQYQKHKVYVPVGSSGACPFFTPFIGIVKSTNQDWTTPLKFNFSATIRERRSPDILLPIINEKQSEEIFTVTFDKKCGEDNDCHTDLAVIAVLLNMT
jgi:Integrin alpha